MVEPVQVEPAAWQMRAEALHATHPVFDHLGARQSEGDRYEVWVIARTAAGEPTGIATRISADQVLPSLAELWAGAAWCEREASEGYGISVGQTDLLLLVDERDRGVLRRQRLLERRQQPWPGSHEPSGKSRVTPLGQARS